MADSVQAKKVFDTLTEMLDYKGWHYERDEETLVVKSGVQGDDLPIQFLIVVNAEKELVQFLSKLPFSVREEKRVDLAVAICIANNGMLDGSFDYDMEDGSIIFRLTSSFRAGSVLTSEVFDYMITVSAMTIDRYNDKFLMLSKGMMTIEKFYQSETN